MADSSVRLALALGRAMTETYVSPLGATYRLLSQVYAPSTCLYHAILDANQAFAGWATAGFDRAIQAYQATLADKNLKACGTMPNELAALQDFARFRLVVATVAAGGRPGPTHQGADRQPGAPGRGRCVLEQLSEFGQHSSGLP